MARFGNQGRSVEMQARSQPAVSAPFYVEYYAFKIENKLVDFNYRIFTDESTPTEHDVEKLLSKEYDNGTLEYNKRIFATAQLPVGYTQLRTISDLSDLYAKKGTVRSINFAVVLLRIDQSVIAIPTYYPTRWICGREAELVMEIEEGKLGMGMGTGITLQMHIDECNRNLKPLICCTSSGDDIDPPAVKHFVLFLDRKFVSTIEKYPSTIGKERLMIQSQRLLFPNKEFWSSQIRELETKFSSWRKSRGDGNCYYRAVSVSFLETMLRYRKFPELQKLYNRLLKQEDYEVQSGFEIHHYLFLKEFGQFINTHQHSKSIVKEFQQLEMDYAFDNAMIGVFRSMAGYWLRKNENHDEIFPYVMDTGIEPVLREVLKDECEGEGLAFVGMANAINAKIHHIIVDQNAERTHTETFTPFSNQYDVEFSLLLRPGHYDLIYMRDFDEVDGYDLLRQEFRELS